MAKKIYTVVEEWDNCADYPEDLRDYTKILVSTNSIKDAKHVIRKRKEIVMSYLDTVYLDETTYKIAYDYDAEWMVGCSLYNDEFGICHTYCGDSYAWFIIENDLIENES